MKFHFLTLNPEFFEGFLKEGIIKNAVDNGLISINFINFREFSKDKHRSVDDAPYGGGPGMILKPEPIVEAVESIGLDSKQNYRFILPTPQGVLFNNKIAEQLSGLDSLVFICGRYEGIDARVRLILEPMELSIGDYVISNGETASLVMFNTITRYIDGVLGNPESLEEESCAGNYLEYPQYTRPAEYRGFKVPQVLLNGNHKEIREWRKKESLRKTKKIRPDLTGEISSIRS